MIRDSFSIHDSVRGIESTCRGSSPKLPAPQVESAPHLPVHLSGDHNGEAMVPFRQMCLTMNIDIPSIDKHICRKGTKMLAGFIVAAITACIYPFTIRSTVSRRLRKICREQIGSVPSAIQRAFEKKYE